MARVRGGFSRRTSAVRERLRGPLRPIVARVAPGAVAVRRVSARLLGPLVAVVTRLGWAVLALGLIAWIVAWQLGWVEMAVFAAACGLILLAALPFLVGGSNLTVSTTVDPQRVTVGEALVGELSAENHSKLPAHSMQLDLPVGAASLIFDLPPLLPGKSHSELFVVPTERRGVIVVGPPRTTLGDPVGIYRREASRGDLVEIFVHPKVTPLEPLGAGLIRDLEGNSSQHVSMSDLTFHALREYVPGDDLRHVHWRSTARHGKLLVRQYLDTRRSHLTAIVDSNAESYRSESDYETAMSVAASLLVRALQDGYDVSFLSGDVAMSKAVGRPALDACSRATAMSASIVDVASRGAQLAPETSLVVLLTGPHANFLSLQRAATQFSVEVGRLAIRADSQVAPGIRNTGDLLVLSLAELSELPSILKVALP